MNLSKLLLCTAIVLIQGCTTVYQYQAQTSVTMPGDDKTYPAYISWEVQQSLFTRSSEVESDVELRVCKKGVTVKRLSEQTQRYLLPARSGDRLTHKVDSQGQLFALGQARLTRPEDSCGELWVDERQASEQDLRQGGNFALYFLCQSSNKNRYAKVDRYVFDPVIKTKVNDGDEKPDLCGFGN